MRLVCRIKILFWKAKRQSNTVHYLAQYQQTRFVKNENCLVQLAETFRPVLRRKVTVMGRSESLLNVCRLAWVQTGQSSSAVTASLRFGFLLHIEDLDTPSQYPV